jgi:alkaline phosphatase D
MNSEQEAEEAEITDTEAFSPSFVDTTVSPHIIAFGSCNKLDKPQTMWQAVSANNPDLWIWLGDIIYADTTNMKALAAHYKRLKTSPDYKLVRTKAQVIGIYDDHDYGKNDACKYYPMKKGSKKALMDFLDVPLSSPVRRREGAYQSYTFGKGPQSVKVILLDLRYFRDSLVPDPSKQKRYLPNTDGDMLGEAQWKWLENELSTSKAGLNILCSSVQAIADEHPYEKWGKFPQRTQATVQAHHLDKTQKSVDTEWRQAHGGDIKNADRGSALPALRFHFQRNDTHPERHN